MIRSITFDLHAAENYILTHNYKEVLKKGKSKARFEAALKKFDEEQRQNTKMTARRYINKNDIYREYMTTVEDGYQNPQLVENLKDRTINFVSDKINVIFGPNASGKTTILRAIAANALCGCGMNLDGFTNPTMFEPLDLDPSIFHSITPWELNEETGEYYIKSQEDYDKYMESLRKNIDKKAGNGAVIDWDGAPVYYENFANRVNTNSFEDFEGSIMGEMKDAFAYAIHSKSISLGQKTMYLFKKIVDTIENKVTTQDIINNVRECKHNVHFYNAYMIQTEYLKKFYNSETCSNVMTFMFDEIDKSLDIINVIGLYKTILPEIIKRYNVQIILISHNPLVLSSLLSPDDYNIISISDEYTEQIKEAMRGVKF